MGGASFIAILVCLFIYFFIFGPNTGNQAPVQDEDGGIESLVKSRWEVLHYIDEFGEDTNDLYCTLKGYGTFSNSAATNEKMIAYIIVDNTNVLFHLQNYGKYYLKGEQFIKFRVKEGNGDIHEYDMRNNNDGDIKCYDKSFYNEFCEILKRNDVITISATENVLFDPSFSYTFKLIVYGFEEAYKQITIND